ncbi:DUF423 domain-containing protein [Pararoseomonas indoligenes]|jgi:uncharacterized membrane protein YgdD (TMEM256/DUF423 family)|uniref:DUF423 domain-containing protein n=1 Tax=Roseomonas indoligenes TaxID=2820811 RepID=A0A940S5E9_9PROT|nr:DUF423 domain-containing protein [Pararoseomonas indoligenes]MBP0494336.1 DUF423 domain-containing protein [Pararoseomonas indoligenes]
MSRLFIAAGALAGLLAVGLSAYAAHGLALDPARTRMIDNALTQQGWHALALIAAGILAERWGGWAINGAGLAFLAGMILFCGAVWYVATTGRSLGPVAPTGGMLLMLGWLLLAVAALFQRA